MDANPERAFALLDFRNAFNTVSRRHILRRAYGNDSLRPLWGLIDTCYGTPEPLLVFEGVELRSTLWSRQGVRQGSVLGPFLFALAIDEELQQLGSDTVAYLDDITVSAAPSEVPAMLSHVETLFGPLGLELNRAKTTVLCATPIPGVSTSRCGVALSSDFVRALGAPIGWDVPAMRAYILRAAEKQQLFFARVASLHPVVALRLLALCGVPRFTFLARVSPPHLSAQAAEVFDSYVVGALHAILRRPLSPPELALACLPVRLGGLGTRLFSPILGLCYANSVADVPQGQHTETLEREQQLHERLVADFPAVAPLLRASRGRGANLWLVGHGSEDFPRVLPTAAAARIFLSARVGIVAPPPAAHQTLFCRCRARLPDSEVAALHVFSCHRVSRTAMHNAVARTLQRELEAIGIPCSTDLRRFNGPAPISSYRSGKALSQWTSRSFTRAPAHTATCPSLAGRPPPLRLRKWQTQPASAPPSGVPFPPWPSNLGGPSGRSRGLFFPVWGPSASPFSLSRRGVAMSSVLANWHTSRPLATPSRVCGSRCRRSCFRSRPLLLPRLLRLRRPFPQLLPLCLQALRL